MWPSSSTPRYIPKKNEHVHTINLYTHIHNSIICNSQKVETTHFWFGHTLENSSKRNRLDVRATNQASLQRILLGQASPQSFRMVWSHSYNILEMIKLERWKTGSWLPGSGQCRETWKELWGDGTVGYSALSCHCLTWHSCTHVNFLSVSYCACVRCNHWGELGEGYVALLFFQLPVHLQLFQDTRLKKKKEDRWIHSQCVGHLI